MIPRYTDHSANERTYLAWIRTAISIMAFGFLIEKFDLFLTYINQVTENAMDLQPNPVTQFVGLGLILVGVMVIFAATVRFFAYKKSIESEERFPYNVKKTNLILSSLMILLAVFLMVYMGMQIL
jgi:putative membrane protein